MTARDVASRLSEADHWREIDDGFCTDCNVPWEQCDCTFLAYECGMLADGTCMHAGSEDCDWECPRNRPSKSRHLSSNQDPHQ